MRPKETARVGMPRGRGPRRSLSAGSARSCDSARRRRRRSPRRRSGSPCTVCGRGDPPPLLLRLRLRLRRHRSRSRRTRSADGVSRAPPRALSLSSSPCRTGAGRWWRRRRRRSYALRRDVGVDDHAGQAPHVAAERHLQQHLRRDPRRLEEQLLGLALRRDETVGHLLQHVPHPLDVVGLHVRRGSSSEAGSWKCTYIEVRLPPDGLEALALVLPLVAREDRLGGLDQRPPLRVVESAAPRGRPGGPRGSIAASGTPPSGPCRPPCPPRRRRRRRRRSPARFPSTPRRGRAPRRRREPPERTCAPAGPRARTRPAPPTGGSA